ncbi:MAG TPA: LysM peptidoglycan-binding domain-containing protein [Candidatus Scybalocola faecipullorum]|nr:LysM peptidoglycan-binding domain-containing protein [Candidatus Scybalocola faecipullorum]
MNYYSDRLSIQGAAACRGILHTIVKGDTLYKLSRLYGVSLDAIFEANPNTDVYNLAIGQKICIPMSSMSGGRRPQRHQIIVKKGDTLHEILKKYNMTPEQFEKNNPQLAAMILKEGTRINIDNI